MKNKGPLTTLGAPLFVGIRLSGGSPGPELGLSPPSSGFTILLVACCLCFVTAISAQELTPQTLGNAGGSFQFKDIRFSYTVGQTAVGHWYAESRSGGSMTEGFHQPLLVLPELPGAGEVFQVKLFPNPAQAELQVNWLDADVADPRATLVDAQGKVLFTDRELVPGLNRINLTAYPSGLYFLSLRSETAQAQQSFKIIKR